MPALPSAESPAPTEAPPFDLIPGQAASGLLLLCDHAGNEPPPRFGTLGLPPHELQRHIGYDIGAGAVTRRLAAALEAPAVLGRYSRLLIDLNRGEDDPTLIMRLSDGSIVPGNAAIGPAERADRIARYHAPYHRAVDGLIDGHLAAGTVPVLVSIHSFTPRWRGVPRPWHVAILWDSDPRLPRFLLERLSADPRLVVGDNEPYHGALRNDTLFRHGTAGGLPHALIEIRQDLIGDEAGAAAWATRLADILAGLPHAQELRQRRHYGSLTGPVATIA